MRAEYDAVIIGGGVIGCSVALHLRRSFPRVLLVDREPALARRASFANQARVHNGYHYPRSLLTGLRSRVNFPRFVEEYRDCVVSDFEKYYAIATRFSKVTADQFAAFCRRIGAPVQPAPPHVRSLFNRGLIEDVFTVQEYAFDAMKLADRLALDLSTAGVDVQLGVSAETVRAAGDGTLIVDLGSATGAVTVTARHVFNCTYSDLNGLLQRSGLPLIPLKHEITEVALVDVPTPMRGMGITVMCGPFFSVMPFPSRGRHSFTHVRYTPHRSWQEPPGRATAAVEPRPSSNFERMRRDAQRYLPLMRDVVYDQSLFETKTVLPSSEMDDSRPILFKRDHGLPNLTCIMGGKIDNIYDVLTELDVWREAAGSN